MESAQAEVQQLIDQVDNEKEELEAKLNILHVGNSNLNTRTRMQTYMQVEHEASVKKLESEHDQLTKRNNDLKGITEKAENEVCI